MEYVQECLLVYTLKIKNDMKKLLFIALTTQKSLLLSLKVFEEVYFYRGEFILGTLLELVVFFVCLFLCQLCGNLASMGKNVFSR